MTSLKNNILELLRKNVKSDFDWYLFIILLLIYVIFTPNKIIGVNFYLLLFLILIIYLTIFNRLYLIKNSFFIPKNERKPIIIGTIFFIIAISIGLYIKTGGFAPIIDISIYTLFQTFTEELIFRVFLLGVVIEKFHLVKFKDTSFYWTEGQRNGLALIGIMFLISILFADFHKDWLFLPVNLLNRSIIGFIFTTSFVLTNKKIYAPWIIHYINNMYAFY